MDTKDKDLGPEKQRDANETPTSPGKGKPQGAFCLYKPGGGGLSSCEKPKPQARPIQVYTILKWDIPKSRNLT